MLALPAYAKLNLNLRVLGTRPDGYHQITSYVQAISLHDLILVEPAERTSLQGGVATDDLILQAVAALEEVVGRRLPARWRLVKRIPLGSGMAGGSSDAALALRALAKLYRLSVNLSEVAAQLGADIPFFLYGGAQAVSGRGEVLKPAPLARGWFGLAWPGFGASTATAYKAWDRLGGEGENQLTRAALEVEPRLRAFSEMLGSGWQMTGSGSAWFLHCSSRSQAEAAIAPLQCWKAVVQPVGRWKWEEDQFQEECPGL